MTGSIFSTRVNSTHIFLNICRRKHYRMQTGPGAAAIHSCLKNIPYIIYKINRNSPASGISSNCIHTYLSDKTLLSNKLTAYANNSFRKGKNTLQLI